MSIRIFYDEIEFRLNRSAKARNFIDKVIREEGRIPGDLNFIFTNDKNLREINKEFLKHDYNTDVISFNYDIKNTISGEIYISIETVNRNASEYAVSIEEETIRVMIHGVLHLCGYDDKTSNERSLMERIENNRIKNYIRSR